MARTQAVLPGGARLSDYLSVGVIAQIFPLPAVRAALDACSQRQRSLPAEVMAYYGSVRSGSWSTASTERGMKSSGSLLSCLTRVKLRPPNWRPSITNAGRARTRTTKSTLTCWARSSAAQQDPGSGSLGKWTD